MAHALLTLKLASLQAWLSGGPRKVFPALVFLAGATWASFAYVLTVQEHAQSLPWTGAAISLLFFVLPLMVPGGRTMLPVNLRRYRLSTRELVLAAAIDAAVSIPFAALVAFVVAIALQRWAGGASAWGMVAAAAASLLSVGALYVLGRVASAARAGIRIATGALAATASAVVWLASGVLGDLSPVTDLAARALSWSPFGAPWSAMGTDRGPQFWSALFAALTGTLVTSCLSVLLIAGEATRSLEARAPARGLRRKVIGDGLLAAIILRQRSAWVHDARAPREAIVNFAVLILVAASVWALPATRSSAIDVLVFGAIAFIAMDAHNSISRDGTRSWQEITARVRGVQALMGRAFAPMAIGAALAVGYAVVLVCMSADGIIWRLAFGFTVAIWTSACAVFFAAFLPYAWGDEHNGERQLLREVGTQALLLIVVMIPLAILATTQTAATHPVAIVIIAGVGLVASLWVSGASLDRSRARRFQRMVVA